VLARAANVEKVDAGPAAIALTPRQAFRAEDKLDGVEEKNGRFLLREQIDDPLERVDRVDAMLEKLVS
jgi:transcription-repair coupling factor (superfamily II helicase)